MHKILIILMFVLVGFLIKFVLFNTIGGFFTPNVMLLLVVFFNLFWGIRHALVTAVWAGTLEDSFGAGPFGIHLFSLVVAAFATVLLKRTIYQAGSGSSRFILVLIVSAINLFTQYILYLMLGSMDFFQLLRNLFIPEVLLTALSAYVVFRALKKCVSKLYV